MMKYGVRFNRTSVFKKKCESGNCTKCPLDKFFKCRAEEPEEERPNRQIDTLLRR